MGSHTISKSLSGPELLDWQLRHVLKKSACMEHRFHPTRKWRFELCFPNDWPKLGIEVDGGVFMQGRHTRGSGFIKDMEKLNEAAILGYRILRFTPAQVKDGTALNTVERFFKGDGK